MGIKEKIEENDEVIKEEYRECDTVIRGMRKYGGGFILALVGALERADINNIRKIKATWSKEWEQYTSMAKRMKEQEQLKAGGVTDEHSECNR